MSKLDAIKEKVTNVRTQLAEKTDQIPLVKKWKAAREEAAKRGPDPLSLGEIYRKGGIWIRIQVLLIFVLAAGALGFGVQAGKRIFQSLARSPAHDELAKEYSHGLHEVQEHAKEEAKVVSLGQFNANAFGGPKGEAMVNMDVWLRVSDPDAAAYVEQNVAKLNDIASERLNHAYHTKVNFLSEEGKATVKADLISALNAALPKGKVEDLFFQNLVVQ